MDPSHAPFAHHAVQSKRTDGCFTPISPLSDVINDSTHYKFGFEDLVRGKKRTGTMSFYPPCTYILEDTGRNVSIIFLVVPVSSGKSRAFVGLQSTRPIPKFVPMWFTHSIVHRFLDSDLFVHDQERIARGTKEFTNAFTASQTQKYESDELEIIETSPTKKSPVRFVPFSQEQQSKYVLLSQSDAGVLGWRKWWARHLSLSPVFGPQSQPPLISVEQQVDRFEGHTRYCRQCQLALQRAEKVCINVFNSNLVFFSI